MKELDEKISDRWWAVIHVMTRLHLFKPYLKFVEYLLDRLCGL